MTAETAAAHGVVEGDLVSVSTARGSVTLTVAVVEGADDTVWLPTNSEDSHVRVALGSAHGSSVTLSRGGGA